MQLGMIGLGRMGGNMLEIPRAIWMMVPAGAVDSLLVELAARLRPGDIVIDGGNSYSGEGRWTIMAAIEASAPAPVLSAALFQRFTSRGEADFSDRLLSAMRYQFGGHRDHRVDELAGSPS